VIAIMKSMTVHGIDKQLADLIKSRAEAEGLSINKTIKKLLETALGVKPRPPRQNLNDFKEFCDIWTEEDLKEFEENTSDTSTIDPEDWQ
jgi:hypothetical protein